MGRWGGKDTTEGYKTITTKFLKQYNYLVAFKKLLFLSSLNLEFIL